MKKSRLPRPVRSPHSSSPVRRALPVLASAALLAGCSLSTAPGDATDGGDGVYNTGGTGGIGLPYVNIGTTGTGGSPFERTDETGGTGGATTTGGSSGYIDFGPAGVAAPPYEEIGGTTNETDETLGAAGALNAADHEEPPITNDASGN